VVNGVNPSTTIDPDALVAVVLVMPPGNATAVYDVIGDGVYVGAVYVIVILVPLSAVAVPMVGACGT
jgi:hypothetical protein